ncbi:MAG: hypothetical protein QM645_04590 [Asticcacaulis sp.]
MFKKIKRLLLQKANESPGSKSQPVKVNVENEEGFVDITLPIGRVERLAHGAVLPDVLSMNDGREIGFQIEVLTDWSCEVKGEVNLYWGEVRFHSLGDVSDRFLATLASAYGQNPGGYTMTNIIDFTAVGLNTDPREIGVCRQDLKLFFDEEASGIYAEVFTNIDLERGIVEFREKDQAYRLPLLSALTVSNEFAIH